MEASLSEMWKSSRFQFFDAPESLVDFICAFADAEGCDVDVEGTIIDGQGAERRSEVWEHCLRAPNFAAHVIISKHGVDRAGAVGGSANWFVFPVRHGELLQTGMNVGWNNDSDASRKLWNRLRRQARARCANEGYIVPVSGVKQDYKVFYTAAAVDLYRSGVRWVQIPESTVVFGPKSG